MRFRVQSFQKKQCVIVASCQCRVAERCLAYLYCTHRTSYSRWARCQTRGVNKLLITGSNTTAHKCWHTRSHEQTNLSVCDLIKCGSETFGHIFCTLICMAGWHVACMHARMWLRSNARRQASAKMNWELQHQNIRTSQERIPNQCSYPAKKTIWQLPTI